MSWIRYNNLRSHLYRISRVESLYVGKYVDDYNCIVQINLFDTNMYYVKQCFISLQQTVFLSCCLHSEIGHNEWIDLLKKFWDNHFL